MANGAFCCWAVIFPIAIYLKLWDAASAVRKLTL